MPLALGALCGLSSLALVQMLYGFSGGSDSRESACNVGDLGSTPGWGRSPGEGNGYPLQYSCMKNPMDRGAWRATVHGVAESETTEATEHKCLHICTFCMNFVTADVLTFSHSREERKLIIFSSN